MDVEADDCGVAEAQGVATMVPMMLVSAALLAAPPDPTDGLKAYEVARAKVGRDAASQVRLALWCEAHGLGAQREKHLALAVLTDPMNAAARGLLGLVAHGGKWLKPEAVSEAIRSDTALSARLAEYDARRDRLEAKLRAADAAIRRRPDGPAIRADELFRIEQRKAAARAYSAQEHVALGLWCESRGLKDEAGAHFKQAVLLDPYRDATWKHLGYVRHDGRWMTPAQIDAAQKEAEAQRAADRRWGSLLRKWRGALVEEGKRDEALRRLAEVDDPRAVPSILAVFGKGHDQGLVVAMLGRIETPAATLALATLAVTSPLPSVRSEAIKALRGRSFRDYAGLLVDQIRAPMTYKVLAEVGGPGSPGAMEVETPRFRAIRAYDAPPVFQPGTNFFGYAGLDPNGLPVIASGRELIKLDRQPSSHQADLAQIEARTAQMIADANLKAIDSQQRLVADVREIEATNAYGAEANERIGEVLRGADDAPASLRPDDEVGWQRWYYDKVGYSFNPAPQVILTVLAAQQPPSPSVASCFAAGTLVRTRDGRKPIESLRVGDQVLSQDVTTGLLGFRPVSVVHRNPPGQILRVTLDDGATIPASIYHRFWRAGRGWAMARELKPGDALRTLDGRARVVSVSPGDAEPLFNLDVEGTRTYFVGDHDALVHDNTLPDPHLKPFDVDVP